MKRINLYAWAAVALMGVSVFGSCVSNGQDGSAGNAGDSVHVSLVKPLQPDVVLDSITDAALPVAFTADSFNWMGGNLTMTVYAETVYDSLEVQQMVKGDSIVYDGRTIVAHSIMNKDGRIIVNGGYSEDGLDLQSTGHGTYRASIEDDYSVYVELGQAELPLADDFTITDCGEDPADKPVTVSSGQKLYLESLKGYRREFSNLNTTVTVKDGLITGINRIWIP